MGERLIFTDKTKRFAFIGVSAPAFAIFMGIRDEFSSVIVRAAISGIAGAIFGITILFAQSYKAT